MKKKKAATVKSALKLVIFLIISYHFCFHVCLCVCATQKKSTNRYSGCFVQSLLKLFNNIYYFIPYLYSKLYYFR